MGICKKDNSVVALDGYAAGYLVKRGERLKTWRRRYFVFQGGFLSYRKDSREQSKQRLCELVVDVKYFKGKKHGLSVRLATGRVLCLAAQTEEQLTTWYDVFDEYLARLRKYRELNYVHGKRNQHLDTIAEDDCDDDDDDDDDGDCDYDSDRNTFSVL
ncbi:hypothetical protein PybrP1_008622 [[Pythium] brassicae (nom. inval.)]|nr:hypothetical protein PybrP1_008622 [[Pythium] brassicae (nom. inval.)]